MPNLLAVSMPELTVHTPMQPGMGGNPSSVKSALLSEGSQVGTASLTFSDALGEQLINATEWLNLTADGNMPTALLLPTGGNGLPPTGEELQLVPGDHDAIDGMSDAQPFLMAMPLLPPGMMPLEDAGAGANEGEMVLTGTRRESAAVIPGAVKSEAGAGLAALLSGSATGGREAAGQPVVADAVTGTTDEAMLLLARENIAGERFALQRGNDPVALRGIAGTLQGSEQLLQAVPMMAGPGYAAGVTTQSPAVPGLPQFTIDIPPGQPGWGEALGERVNWMLNNQQPGAQLRINPPHLGPLEIRVSVHHDQASVTFTAHHAATADHLEAALPRLREMLADNGLQLAQFDVRHQGNGAAPQGGDGNAAGPEGELVAAATDSDDGETVKVTPLHGSGLVDAYA